MGKVLRSLEDGAAEAREERTEGRVGEGLQLPGQRCLVLTHSGQDRGDVVP